MVVLACAAAQGQEPLRLSLAGAEAARARREAAEQADTYNLRLGPTAWGLGAALGVEANDNIWLEAGQAREDLIFHPGINVRMLWPVSDVNSLTFACGAGYSAYVQHPEFNRFYLTPGSQLSFDLYIGDFWINCHDRFSITENNYQDPTVVGSADYALLMNAVGESTTWDLNKALVQLGYDHVNYVSLPGSSHNQGGQPDGQSEVLAALAGYRVTPAILTGIELGGSLVSYAVTSTSQVLSDATEWNAGSFVEARLSQYLRGHASLGYTVYSPDAASGGANMDFKGLYAEVELSHRLNQYLEYTLTGGRTVNFAFYGGTVELWFLRWQADWKLIRKFTLGSSFAFEHGRQLETGGETFDRYGPSVSLSRKITRKLSAAVAYQFFWRGSDLPDHDYTDNILTLNGTYEF